VHLYADDLIDMLVDERYQKNVGYFVVEIEEDGVLFRVPVGTVFFVCETVQPGGYGVVNYAVTCRHVLECAFRDARFKGAFIRVNNSEGELDDIPSSQEDWCAAADTDVAAARFDPPDDVDIWATHMSNQMNAVMPGHELFLIGMFHLMQGVDSVQALVRSGRVARPYMENVPITLNPHSPEDITTVTAHLIEALAWGGQSGSPVYIHDQYHVFPKPQQPDTFGILLERDSLQRSKITATDVGPPLFGLLYGSFTLPHSVRDSEDAEIGGVSMNTGIAIVIPAENIRQLLWRDKFAKDRERTMVERREQNIAKGLNF
jgi:hypothetical protein